jgi:hypothetical protein
MPPPDAQTVVRQVHEECLGALYSRDYYRAFHSNTTKYAKSFDFAIALGSAVSGGTGLGILANPAFGWVCGSVTTLSVLLSVAKGVYDWPGKTKFAIDRIQFYENLYSKYRALVDDIGAAREWNSDFAARREALRDRANPDAPDPYGELSGAQRGTIQNAIKARINYKDWWVPA